MIKGILFDKDGTLIEFEKMWHSIMTIIFKKIEKQNLMSMDEIDKIKEHSGYLENGFSLESKIQYLPTSKIISKWMDLVKKTNNENLENQLTTIFNDASMNHAVIIELLPGAMEMIPYLSEKYFIGIATADTESSMQHSLKKTGLYEYFNYFGSDNGCLKGKPDPMMAKEFCKVFEIELNELLIVGDSVSDFEFAVNSNANFVGIYNDYGILKQHIEEQALDIKFVSDLNELVKVMDL